MEVDFEAFFQGVTAEKAPAFTAALIKMFAEGGEAGQQFANTTVAAFDRVGAAADRMASSIRAAMAAQRAQAVHPARRCYRCRARGIAVASGMARSLA